MIKRTTIFVGIICIVFMYKLCNIHAYMYKEGLITVKHEESVVKKNGHLIQLNHPYKVTEDVITNVLSSVYYKEKGLFKRQGTLRVYQDEEIRKLVPLIVKALSTATPSHVVVISSYHDRLILTDRKNYCALFIVDHSLNIAFSRVHMFQTYNDIMSDKKRYLVTREENPVKKRRSSFWKLIPSPGQQLVSGHENWLIIDLNEIK